MTWLSQSGISSNLPWLYLFHTMLLEERTLAAVDAIVHISKDSLEGLALSFSPDIESVTCELLSQLTVL